MGKAHASGLGEVDFSPAIYSYYADDAERFLSDEHITLLDGEGSAVIRRRPLGVLVGIMPWNYPSLRGVSLTGSERAGSKALRSPVAI